MPTRLPLGFRNRGSGSIEAGKEATVASHFSMADDEGGFLNRRTMAAATLTAGMVNAVGPGSSDQNRHGFDHRCGHCNQK
jgi:hypothetical protein